MRKQTTKAVTGGKKVNNEMKLPGSLQIRKQPIKSSGCVYHIHLLGQIKITFLYFDSLLHGGSYMSAHVQLNLLKELGKRDKMRGLPSIL